MATSAHYRRAKHSDLQKVYKRGEDKNICTIAVSADKNGTCYADTKFTKAIDQDTLIKLFMKGFIIEYEDGVYKPLTLFLESDRAVVLAITLKTVTGDNTETLDYIEFYSGSQDKFLDDPEEEAYDG